MQGRDLGSIALSGAIFPVCPLLAFGLCLLIALGQNYEAFVVDKIDLSAVIATYIGIPTFSGDLAWLSLEIQNTRYQIRRDRT